MWELGAGRAECSHTTFATNG